MKPDAINHSSIQTAYDEQYTDQMTEWREIGGKYKAANILKVCGDHKFNKVVEYGAGEGSILKYLDSSGTFSELYALELSETGISQILKRNLPRLKEVKKFNGYETPYTDKEFDLAYCSHVIEHVEYPRLLLREIRRISHFQVFEIPLDYSNDVDSKIKYFLSYGHINIFTPSLFKFLLKSEGYEIISEHFSHTSVEVIRLNWYKNRRLKKTFLRESILRLRPVYLALKRLLQRKSYFEEYGYNAYTCLAVGSGELKVL
ncbi:MAG: class I SAM-dependent methyltransferase [Chloroflexi bacterium]|nr:class I SAM-dependent methyltransferase [Chloroflexota bacterium]